MYLQIVDFLRANKLAGRRYEKAGHGRFCDCISIYRNKKVRFERFNYGEAAGLVYSIWGTITDDGTMEWTFTTASSSSKQDVPKKITEIAVNESLRFDNKPAVWEVRNSYKTAPEASLGRFALLLGK